jgi:NAD(P)-dependent dehydrogenase (short-subunit alcohol dehydrogenase family)
MNQMEVAMILRNKIAVVIGGGQTPGETIGNGRATAVQFAREGAHVMVGDLVLESAQETVDMIQAEGGKAIAQHVDVSSEASLGSIIEATIGHWGRIDVLHNNVGVSLAAGDAVIEEITSEAFDRLVEINLRGMVLACKHVLPHMREQGEGVIINVSSMAVLRPYQFVGYKTTKAGVIVLTEQLAQGYARYGIRANAILPGLMNTPMAIEPRITPTMSRDQLVAERDNLVP